MAKRKKRKTASAPRKYLALWSECNGASQFTVVNDGRGSQYAFDTPAKAQNAIKDYIECDGAMSGVFAVAEVIMLGKPTGVEWTASVNLKD